MIVIPTPKVVFLKTPHLFVEKKICLLYFTVTEHCAWYILLYDHQYQVIKDTFLLKQCWMNLQMLKIPKKNAKVRSRMSYDLFHSWAILLFGFASDSETSLATPWKRIWKDLLESEKDQKHIQKLIGLHMSNWHWHCQCGGEGG